jgi:hypothetical protein
MCPAQILASQPSNTIIWNHQLREQNTFGSASNKKTIRWMFCLRARVNDPFNYQWGVKNLLRRHVDFLFCACSYFSFNFFTVGLLTTVKSGILVQVISTFSLAWPSRMLIVTSYKDSWRVGLNFNFVTASPHRLIYSKVPTGSSV